MVSGKSVVVPDQGNCFNYPENRIINEYESMMLGQELKIPAERLEGISLDNVGDRINDVAFFSSAHNFGKIQNNIESEVNVHVQNCFRSILSIQSKNVAYNYYVFQTEALFGCNAVRKSNFSMRCYLSGNLSRCFEVDSSRDCSDAYFCHNCENVRESMFCFNVKNLTYAIGNVQLPPVRYMEIKRKILGEIVSSLERDGRYSLNIFNLFENKKQEIKKEITAKNQPVLRNQ